MGEQGNQKRTCAEENQVYSIVMRAIRGFLIPQGTSRCGSFIEK